MTKSLAAGLAALSLGCFWALGTGMVRASSPAFDEPLHLTSGYAAWQGVRGPLKWRSHPPFAERWSALPLLAMQPRLHLDDPSWAAEDVFRFEHLFLYENSSSPERLLGAARLWGLLTWGALLALCVHLAASRVGGPSVAAAAAAFLAFCPPLVSNAALVSTDLPAAALYFSGFCALRAGRPALAGAALGLAMASAFGMVLGPAIALTALLADARLGGRPLSARAVGALAGGLAAALLLGCGGDVAAYFRDLGYTLGLVKRGWPAYLLGRYSEDGFLAYFPVAVLVKTPLPLLICAALGAWVLPRREKAWLLLPPAAYFAAACLSRTQAGYRYVLLIYPFMIVCAGLGLLRAARWSRPAAAALLLWLVAGTLSVHPHHLTYFNEAAVGRDDRWLVDSNLDWGQGLKALASELKRRGDPAVRLSYFGRGDPAHYGIRYEPAEMVPEYRRSAPDPGAPRLLAVSATNLRGLYLQDRAKYERWAAREPLFVAGRSIFVYPLTGQ